VRLLLDSQPLFCLGLLLGYPLPHLVYQDLAAAAGNAVEAGAAKLPHDFGDGQAKPLAEEDDLRRREPVDVDRMMLLDVAHQIEVPLEGDVRIVAPLKQDLHSADRLALVDLGADLLEAQHVAVAMLRPTVERAELAIGDADVGVVDVPVDDVGDHIRRVLPPPLGVRQLAELEETGPLVEVESVLELAGGAVDRAHELCSRRAGNT
jgi:hypothetical protein